MIFNFTTYRFGFQQRWITRIKIAQVKHFSV